MWTRSLSEQKNMYETTNSYAPPIEPPSVSLAYTPLFVKRALGSVRESSPARFPELVSRPKSQRVKPSSSGTARNEQNAIVKDERRPPCPDNNPSGARSTPAPATGRAAAEGRGGSGGTARPEAWPRGPGAWRPGTALHGVSSSAPSRRTGKDTYSEGTGRRRPASATGVP